ncbi:hypothetical protein GLAREA_06781 [Glarea lozoyensis ATCC 20868]|uniref:Uncharacterized protein n=1 Tax=Glarea lozoyensis (strain ATCC 20868 / MF5171) TaxID=1116229 RepID=S3E5X7_GLAL2|nr:uncharacterized protein GLAREA_06781 [Glarea lozoyensis ATCC 20868]EPE33768.1 hypothetical protein GLAREA_06781 [Glarea lozoyensis ATCC 20868]
MASRHHHRDQYSYNGESSSSGASRDTAANHLAFVEDTSEDSGHNRNEASNFTAFDHNGSIENFDHRQHTSQNGPAPNQRLIFSNFSNRSVSGASRTSFRSTDLGDAMEGLELPSSEHHGDEEKTEEEMRIEYEAELVAREQARENITEDTLESFGIGTSNTFNGYGIDFDACDPLSSGSEDEYSDSGMSDRSDFWTCRPLAPQLVNPRTRSRKFDLFDSLGNYAEISLAIAKHLSIQGFLHLYAMSRDFHDAVDQHLTSCVLDNANNMAPESARIFRFTMYDKLLLPDPAGRRHPTRPKEIRRVPGFKYLQMIHHREKTVRDILACLAREGHRTPQGMSLSLKKMWLLMDLSTTRQRVMFMHSRKFFTDRDLYNIQLFIVKLDMRFNDPIEGPAEDDIRKLMLGQRGLTPLRNLLRRKDFKTYEEIIRCQVRYQWNLRPQDRGWPIFGIKPSEVGIGHLEGWGQGIIHLLRPDELVVREAVKRGLDLKNHIMLMMLWGHVDLKTGENISASEEEKYMSDEEPISMKYRWKDDEDYDSAWEEDQFDINTTPTKTKEKTIQELIAESSPRNIEEEVERILRNRKMQNMGMNAVTNNKNTPPIENTRFKEPAISTKRSFMEANDEGANEVDSDADYADPDNAIHNMADDEFDIPDSPIKKNNKGKGPASDDDYADPDNDIHDMTDGEFDIPDSPVKKKIKGKERDMSSAPFQGFGGSINQTFSSSNTASIPAPNFGMMSDAARRGPNLEFRTLQPAPQPTPDMFSGLGRMAEALTNTIYTETPPSITTSSDSSAFTAGPSNPPPTPRPPQSSFGGFGAQRRNIATSSNPSRSIAGPSNHPLAPRIPQSLFEGLGSGPQRQREMVNSSNAEEDEDMEDGIEDEDMRDGEDGMED